MIRISIKNNQGSKTVNAEVTDTPAELFANAGINLRGSQVTLNGCILNTEAQNQSLATLGVQDGTENNTISAIVKADGASN